MNMGKIILVGATKGGVGKSVSCVQCYGKELHQAEEGYGRKAQNGSRFYYGGDRAVDTWT